jgi:hypothetical protein
MPTLTLRCMPSKSSKYIGGGKMIIIKEENIDNVVRLKNLLGDIV